MAKFAYRPVLNVGYRAFGCLALTYISLKTFGYYERKRAMRLIRDQNRLREIQEMADLHRDLRLSSAVPAMNRNTYKLVIFSNITQLPQLKKVGLIVYGDFSEECIQPVLGHHRSDRQSSNSPKDQREFSPGQCYDSSETAARL